MPNAFMFVTGGGSVDPYEQPQIDCLLVMDGVAASYTFQAYPAFDATADEINAAIRAAGVAVAALHSITISDTDVQRVVGGALVLSPT